MTSLTNVVVAGGNAAAAVGRVEMLSPSGFAGLAVSSGLDVHGYVTARQPDLVLIDSAFEDVDVFEVVRRLKQDADTRHIPVIMLNAPNNAEKHREGIQSGLDDMIDETTPDDIVVARLKPFIRLSTMHAECLRRVATAAEFRVSIALGNERNVETTGCRIMIVGDEGPGAERTAAALRNTEFEINLETHHIAAGARLARETFDAAVIVIADDESPDNAYYLCSHIRNNASLFNLPVLIAAGDASNAEKSAYRQGASIALPLSEDTDDLATALRFLVRRQRLRWNLHGPLTATLQKNTADKLDGLYAEAFLHAHLARVLERNLRRRRNVSLAVFSLQNVPGVTERYGPKAGTRLMQNVANQISAMVRVEDIPARLSPIEICAIFPDTEEADARQAADRIAGVLAQANIDIGDGAETDLWMQVGVASAAQGDQVDDLIARAKSVLS